MIKIENLTKSFPNFTAVEGISFEAGDNRILGFLGPNGAGKTTTLRMLVGLSKPTSGKIFIDKKEIIFGQSDNNRTLGYLPEQPAFYNWMSGYEYLTLIGELFGLDKAKLIKKISELLSLVNLTEAANKRISTYSNGMKQRLGIAQALVNDPKVLILDKPVSALDPIGRHEILEIIERLKHDKTIIISTHILSDVDRICDDVAIINKGKLITFSPLAKLKEDFSQSILEVEFSTNPQKLIHPLMNESWQENVEQIGNTLKIRTKGNQAIEQNMAMKFFTKYDLSIIRYAQIVPEIEDLFMALIEKDKS